VHSHAGFKGKRKITAIKTVLPLYQRLLGIYLVLSLYLSLSLCFNSWLCHRDLTERFTSRNSRRPGARQRTRAIDEFPIMRFLSRIRNPTRNRDVSRLISGIQSVLLAGRFFSNPLRDSILFPRGLARSSNKIAGSRAVFSYANNKRPFTLDDRLPSPPSLSLSLFLFLPNAASRALFLPLLFQRDVALPVSATVS